MKIHAEDFCRFCEEALLKRGQVKLCIKIDGRYEELKIENKTILKKKIIFVDELYQDIVIDFEQNPKVETESNLFHVKDSKGKDYYIELLYSVFNNKRKYLNEFLKLYFFIY
jgi:hypothetical protein